LSGFFASASSSSSALKMTDTLPSTVCSGSHGSHSRPARQLGVHRTQGLWFVGTETTAQMSSTC
jgi:hypothetical protein